MNSITAPDFCHPEAYVRRCRPSLDDDVPYWFGLPANYVFIVSATAPAYEPQRIHLQAAYIGMSRAGVDQRLEYHEVAALLGPRRKDLWICIWYLEKPPSLHPWVRRNAPEIWKQRIEAIEAVLRLRERAMLLDYREHHGHLPPYNHR